METYYQLLLVPHIVAGFLALLVAPVAMLVKKGGPSHRFWGKVFFWSIAVVAGTALVMSVWKSNVFLAMVGVFSFYLVASGYRALYRKNVNSLKDVAGIDWILLIVSGVFCLAMVLLGLILLVQNSSAAFGYISLIFGFIGTLLVFADIRSFTVQGHHKKKWINHHIAGMTGGYIATVSAFAVVNLDFVPGVIRWLGPTLIGVPLLLMQLNRYTKKKVPVRH